jgi:hypothetical protein
LPLFSLAKELQTLRKSLPKTLPIFIFKVHNPTPCASLRCQGGEIFGLGFTTVKDHHESIVWSPLSHMNHVLLFAIPQHTTCILFFTLKKIDKQKQVEGLRFNGLQNSLSKLQSNAKNFEEFQAL